MDIVCVYCGEYDGPFHQGLHNPCSVVNPIERANIDNKRLSIAQYHTREWNHATGDNKPIPQTCEEL